MTKNENEVPSYLNGELNKLEEDKLVGQEKVKRAQYNFAEQMKRDIGPNMKKKMKPTFGDKIKLFFKKIGDIYG